MAEIHFYFPEGQEISDMPIYEVINIYTTYINDRDSTSKGLILSLLYYWDAAIVVQSTRGSTGKKPRNSVLGGQTY